MSRRLSIYGSHTEFQVTQNSTNELFIGREARACFGYFVRRQDPSKPIDATISIWLYGINGDRSHVGDRNNNVLVNEEGIKRHMKRLEEIYKISWKTEKVDGCKDNWIVKISGNMYCLQWKLLLTVFRHLYEYPYNIFHYIIDTNNLEDAFPELNYISIFNLVAQTMSEIVYGNEEDGLTYNGRFSLPISYSELKKRVANCISRKDLDVLNTLFEFTQDEGVCITPDRSYTQYKTPTIAILENNSKSTILEAFENQTSKKFKDIPYFLKPLYHNESISAGSFRPNGRLVNYGIKAVYKRVPWSEIIKLSDRDTTYMELWDNTAVRKLICDTVAENFAKLNNYIKEQYEH